MTTDELRALLSNANRLCIDLVLSSEFPGYVRGVYLYRDASVAVEFEQYGHDEGGAYFYGDYNSLPSAIVSLEAYLRRSISEWNQITESHGYPKSDSVNSILNSSDMLARAITDRTIDLPPGADYELRGSAYWLKYNI